MLANTPVQLTNAARSLRDRLLRLGVLYPIPDQDSAEFIRSPQSAAVVVPVFDDTDGLADLLAAIRRDTATVPIIVVDDASPDIGRIEAVASSFNAEVLHQPTNYGPATARNRGWKHALLGSAPPQILIFLDADVVPTPGSLAILLAHFVDPDLAAVAPRVSAQPGTTALAAYEAADSPLDLGPNPAIVQPGSRVSYVPSAALAIRSEILQEAGGFDEHMRVGEDVDLLWRLVDDDQVIRYEPRAVVHHRNRPSLVAFARQRFSYGTSAASLADRHGMKVAPLQLQAPVLATTVAMLLGRSRLRGLGVLLGCASSVLLQRRFEDKIDQPARESLRLTAISHGCAARGLATAASRAWAPLLLITRRGRRTLLAAVAVPAAIDWFRTRPANNPLRHLGLRVLDHGSYCAGVWSGVLRRRSVSALLPDVRMQGVNDE